MQRRGSDGNDHKDTQQKHQRGSKQRGDNDLRRPQFSARDKQLS
jgi:hypothetical protein